VVLEGFGGQALGSVVLVLAANSRLDGFRSETKGAQFHLGRVIFKPENFIYF
jgi:hypothetical protein